jgi:hypothetical protein
LFVAAGSAAAQAWEDRTILTFSEAVMIPGATLAPGTYVFEIANPRTSHTVVNIYNEDRTKLMGTAQAIPTKRADSTTKIQVGFYPTSSGVPALKEWYYPQSAFGHEFMYPEEEARGIAQRSKTLVLSGELTDDADTSGGQLRRLDATGNQTPFNADQATMKEWNEWRKRRPAPTAGLQVAPGEATAPIAGAPRQATRVKVDDLEDEPTKYIGQRVSVDAEVETVFGPRMFTIDERSWGDLEGEILVYMPSQFAAFVREDDRVTVEGTVQRFNLAEVEQEWGWFGLNDEVEVNFVERPVLVADRIVGGDNDIAMFINVSPGADRPVGTSGGLMDLQKFANTDADDLVGELVHLDDVKVVGTAADQKNGFFIDAGGEHVFVLPASPGTMAAAGQAVAIEGVVLELPDGMDDRLKSPGDLNDDIYIYATAVRR